MTAIQQYTAGFFQQQNKYPLVKSTDKSLWTGFHVQVLLVFAHLVSEYEVAGCVRQYSCRWLPMKQLSLHFHGGEHYLRFDPAACEPFVRLFHTLTSAGISLPLRCESRLCFLSCLFIPVTLLTTFSCFTAELKPSLALLFCFRGFLSLFMLLLKTKLALALVEFWCFLVHFIHNGTFLF